MKVHAPTPWFLPVSLLTGLILLSAVPAVADPHGSMRGDSKGMSSGSSPHGKSGSSGSYGREGHPKTSSYEGYGKSHAKKSWGRGYGSRYSGKPQCAATFIKHILKFKEGMNLTDEQEQQLRNIKTNYKKDRIRMKAEVDLANVDLQEVKKNEKASLADVETELNKLHALKAKLALVSIKAIRDAKAVLSEEQRSRVKTMHERMKAQGGSGDYSRYKKDKSH